MGTRRTLYILGPMRGYEHFNFPAFDDARNRAWASGLFDDVISPADMDRMDNKSELDKMTPQEKQVMYAERDVAAVFNVTDVAALPGWENSIGARTEYALAVWLGKNILSAEDFEPLGEVNYNITIKRPVNV